MIKAKNFLSIVYGFNGGRMGKVKQSRYICHSEFHYTDKEPECFEIYNFIVMAMVLKGLHLVRWLHDSYVPFCLVGNSINYPR